MHRELFQGLRLRRVVPIVLVAAAVLPCFAADDDSNPTVRGIVISTHTDGREWGWEVMGSTMESIREVGAGWVAIHPYAVIRDDGSVRFRDFDPKDPPAHLIHPIREAHRHGLKILIKPHLAYWGSPFAWRGEIEFDTREKWDRFWRDYERWIVALAVACHEADGFVVGTELDRTLAHEARWRRVIAGVRDATEAPLTYAANWPDYRRVTFWDALDVIGVQAYFPLSDAPSPKRSDIDRGWRVKMAELSAYAEEQNRRVVFTELGYNRSLEAAERPWEYRVDGPEAEELQATLLGAALQAVESEPAVVGVFLWKWFPDPHPVGRNFQLATPLLKKTISSVWD